MMHDLDQHPPRLRTRSKSDRHSIHPLNSIPDEAVERIGEELIYQLAVGRSDISGDDWADIFARAVGGTHDKSPVGLNDVRKGRVCWSAKTIKRPVPDTPGAKLRLISGRNSVNYSYGISDWKADLQATGDAVLKIWNERVAITHETHEDTRSAVLVRSNDMTCFSVFEFEVHRYDPRQFTWSINGKENLEGRDMATGEHCFTWQPHGAQFTICTRIPSGRIAFQVRRPGPIGKSELLQALGVDRSWVSINVHEAPSVQNLQ